MPDYKDYQTVMGLLKASQEADKDIRENARESLLFVTKRDGQWEPHWYTANEGKPRYTFDQVNPIIDQIAGEIEQADFDIKAKPAGGDSTKEIAQVYDGLIRNIENMSNAKEVYNEAGRQMVTCGMDCWRVVNRFVDDDSFDQDLMIEKINNSIDRVWFDTNSEKRDRSDSEWCFVLQSLSKEAYKERWPDRTGMSVSEDRMANAYFHRGESIVVGEFYYIKRKKRDLVLMSNGAVYEDNEDFKKIRDELKDSNINEVRRRTRDKKIVYIRKFDGEGWIDEPKETVFGWIPVIPTYGNFKVVENKITFWGVVDRLIDPQRVLNYSLSREIEEGALAPRAKYWMSMKQAAGHEDSLQTMNTNANPVQFFNPDPELPGAPQQNGGAQINPGLRTVSESMQLLIGKSAGLFSANMGDNPGLQSGIAIQQLQNKGDTGTIKYFKSQEIAICHTARILIDAIPAVYDTERQVRLLNEDGTLEMSVINQPVIDNETGKTVMLNDLNQGKYDVTCSAGTSFKNRQQEMIASFIEAAKVDESLMQIAGDVFLKNMAAPGMDDVAERKRALLLQQGAIPQSQLTDGELQQLQAQAAQPKEPDPMALAAMAEMEKAKADQMDAQNKQIQIQADFQIRQQQLQIEAAKLQQSGQKDAISASQKQQEFDLKLEQMQQNLVLSMQEQQRKMQETLANIDKTQADTLKALREAMGVDAIVSPAGAKAYEDQARDIVDD